MIGMSIPYEYTIEASYVAFGSHEHVAENDRQYNIYFTLNDSANVSMNNIEPVIKQIAASCGIEEKNVIVNDLYLQWILQPSYETIAVCGILILALYFSLLWSFIIFFRSVLPTRYRSMEKLRLGSDKKADETTDLQRGHFFDIFFNTGWIASWFSDCKMRF